MLPGSPSGALPRAIKPPTDPGAPSNPTRGALGSGPSVGSQAGPPFTPASSPPFTPASSPATDVGPAKAGQPGMGSAFPAAAKPPADTPRPKTGVPPWEITDSFMAVPPAEASGTARAGGTGAAASTPSYRPRSESPAGGDSADSTESFPAVGSSAEHRSFPRSNPGDSTESFPALRPRADLEDAFRLFPPVRGTDNQPPAGDGQG